MNDDSERALRAVLDEEADQDVPCVERLDAERDIMSIRRGLALLAAQTDLVRSTAQLSAGADPAVARDAGGRKPGSASVDTLWRWWRGPRRVFVTAGSGIALAAVVAGFVVLGPHTAPRSSERDVVAYPPSVAPTTEDDVRQPTEDFARPTAVSSGSGSDAQKPGPPLTLPQRVTQADRIVIGTVTRVDRGVRQVQGGVPYILASVRVEETLKGPAGDVVALEYDYTGKQDPDSVHTPWSVGDHVLLFLVPDQGTIFADVRPTHLQVAGGERGRYHLDGGQLVRAGFTLDDVRRLAG